MAETETRSTKQLFNDWRKGDSQAGQAMAQRFADWYYAITTSRLGETRGREPCDASCQAFGEGIVSVTESRALVGWAHDIVVRELDKAGSRAMDGDEPNAYTGDKSPKDLLCQAREALADEVALLETTYRDRAPSSDPLAVLKARYRVKQWLRDNQGVPFEVAPDDPVLDRAPLPLYESGAMASPQEEVNFEHWMISDIDLCKDIAEFAHFSIALRGGLPSAAQWQPSTGGGRMVSAGDASQNPGCLARLFGG